MKALAFAAVLLTSAALAALAVTGYLRHRRVVHTEEPIGIPIGVTDAVAPAPAVTADSTNAMTSDAAPPTAPAIADSNSTQSEPPVSSDHNSGPPGATEENAPAPQVVVAQVQPTTTAPAATPPAPDPAPDPAENATTLLLVPDSPEVASTSRVEAAPTPARSTDGEVREVDREKAPKKIIMREVRRAELVEEPEVRRAEPAPPEEGPAEVEPTATPPRAVKPRNSKPKAPARPPEKKSEPIMQPPRQANEKIYLPRLAR